MAARIGPCNASVTLTWDVSAIRPVRYSEGARSEAREFIQYIDKNQGFIVNYGDRFRHGEPIATSFVESA